MTLSDIHKFFELIDKGEIEVYNEASVQFELGWYLKKKFPSAKISLERNISHLKFNKSEFEKSETDILFTDTLNHSHSIIELKAPINQDQVRPVTVFEWIKDLKFLEQLTKKGISCYSIFITDNKGYLDSNRKTGRLLKDFRNKNISGEYQKHLKSSEKNEIIFINNTYQFEWKAIGKGLFYFIAEPKLNTTKPKLHLNAV